jgi:hypothetical protein
MIQSGYRIENDYRKGKFNVVAYLITYGYNTVQLIKEGFNSRLEAEKWLAEYISKRV